jgi:UDP-N-acetyl-D-mannosaminuronic acid dehydrogenase
MTGVMDELTAGPDSLDGVAIAVWGLGKLGLPLAAVLADHGASVTGVDIDASVVERVNAGRSPISGEPGLASLVQQHAGGGLRATSDGTAAARDAGVHIILVPTILDEESQPELSALEAAVGDIATGVSAGDLVILESTVPVGTTRAVVCAALQDVGLAIGTDVGVAFCPERTSSGRVIEDLTASYPKIVGGVSPASAAAARALYGCFNAPGVIVMESLETAEAVKLFEGVYRDVNIALANELARVSDSWGIDADAAFRAANTQPYCDLHTPGIGVGGHCIPVYPWFVMATADETPLVRTARSVNSGMPHHVLRLLERRLAAHEVPLAGSQILVLGLTYRPGVDELRYAPALDLIDALVAAGARVIAHDPITDLAAIDRDAVDTVSAPTDAVGVDAAVLATGHRAYRDLDLGALRGLMRTPVMIDGRRFFDPEEATAAGIELTTVGGGTRVDA